MLRDLCIVVALLGCRSSSSVAPPPPTTTAPREDVQAAERAELERRSELAAAHRNLEDEQSTALAATCAKPAAHAATQRCTPSCYPAEPLDARAGKKLAGPAEIEHFVCTRFTNPPSYLIADELGGAKLEIRAVRGRFPKASKPGSWQAIVEAEVTTALQPELVRRDVVKVLGTWNDVTHPITKELLRCMTVSHYANTRRTVLDGCGGRGTIGCEATGNAAAHGINVVHYRLAEAKRLRDAGDETQCQQAALEAIAVARGMPRWRQYATLNTNQWKAHPRYRTRFDGTLDEDALFARAIELGGEAESVYVACGGPANPKTTAAHEQSFHSCR